MEEMTNDRVEAIGRANIEADAAAAASMREEADRLLEEHRDRTAQLPEEMKVRQTRMPEISANNEFARSQTIQELRRGVRPA